MISIKRCLRPYTLVPGAPIAIPGSSLYATVFPTRVRIFNADRQLVFEECVKIQRPLRRFAVFQDLHRGVVKVVTDQYKYYLLPSGEKVSSLKAFRNAVPRELLSLGMHKHLDIAKVRSRKDLREILPIFFRLGVLLTHYQQRQKEPFSEGSFALIDTIYQKIRERQHDAVGKLLYDLSLAGFTETLLPRLYDDQFLGIIPDPIDASLLQAPIPFHLYEAVYQSILFMLIRNDSDGIAVLPSLPPEFHCGRCLHIPITGVGVCNLEWTKKRVRRVEISCTEDVEKSIGIHFSSSIRKYRLREIPSQEKERLSPQEVRQYLEKKKIVVAGEKIALKSGNTYLLDCFCQ